MLVNVVNQLALLSSIEYKIKLAQWIDIAIKWMHGMSEDEAKAYFLTYRALLEDVDQPTGVYNRDTPH